MASIADYVGREVDLAAFQVMPGFKPQLLVQELVTATQGGTLTGGIQRLAQHILQILFQKKGSKPYDGAAGTDFLRDAQAGLWRTVTDVEQSFYAARIDVRRQIQDVERDTDFDDERYGTLDLDQVLLADGKVTMRINVTSLAGNTVTYLAPLTVPLH